MPRYKGEAMNPPPIQRLGPAILLQGAAIDAVAYAIKVAQRSRRRNGLPDSGALAALGRAFENLSAAGQSDSTTDAEGDTEDVNEWITATEAAPLLGCSPRQARRLAPSLGGRLAGGRWLLDPQAVREHIDRLTT